MLPLTGATRFSTPILRPRYCKEKRFEVAENEKARRFFRRSNEPDPQFALASAALAFTQLNEITLFRPHVRGVNLPLALEFGSQAVSVDAMDASGHAALARAPWISGRHAESLTKADMAVSLDSSSAAAHGARGGARLWGGFPRDAIEPLRIAMRLNPFDPLTPLWMHFIARALYWSGDYEGAIAAVNQVRQLHPNFRQPYNTLIAALGQVGRGDEARAVMTDALERMARRSLPSWRCPCMNCGNFVPLTVTT